MTLYDQEYYLQRIMVNLGYITYVAKSGIKLPWYITFRAELPGSFAAIRVYPDGRFVGGCGNRDHYTRWVGNPLEQSS